jgi:serine protease inhibitor
MMETKTKGSVFLNGVLEPGAHVTLVTTVYYSGGWVTHPDFNYTTMAAADTI